MRIIKVNLMCSIRMKSRPINCLDPGRCFPNSKLNSMLATLIHGSAEKYRKLLIVNI